MRPLGWVFFLSPSLFALVIFLLAFSDTETLTLENGDVGMVGEPVQQGCDASGVWKNSVPVLEGEIGSQHDGTSRVVARIDDVEEEVGGVFVIGEIAQLVDAKQLWAKVLSQTLASELGGIGVELVEHVGNGTNEHGVAFEHGLVGDVFEDHGFAEPVGAKDDEVASLAEEVEGQCGLDGAAVDLLGPVPVEIGDGFESTDFGEFETALETPTDLAIDFDTGELFEDLTGREPFLRGAGQEVIEVVGDVVETERGELRLKLSRLRGRQSGRAHRRPPGLEVGSQARSTRDGYRE